MDQSANFLHKSSVTVTGNWALLIDGENVASSHAEEILSVHPEAFSVRRVYGEYGQLYLKGWTDVPQLRLMHASKGHNSADILLVIEAMSLAQTGMRNFVIVSGDGGMIHLVRHLREMSCRVEVMAPIGCSAALRNAGHKFDELADTVVPSSNPKVATPVAAKPAPADVSVASKLEKHVRNLVAASASDGITLKQINKSARDAFPKRKESHISIEEWRKWLRARPKIFLLDPPGPQERVRIAPPTP